MFQLVGNAALAFPHKHERHYDTIIVRVDALGDYILWRDSLDAYRNKLEGKKTLLICADLVRPLAEAENLFSDIWSFNRKKFEFNFTYFQEQLRFLRTLSADCVINPNWERHRIGDIMVKAIRSSCKIGMESKCCNYFETRYYNRQYTTLIPSPDTASEIEAIQYFTQNVISGSYHYGGRQMFAFDSVCPIAEPYVVFAISASDERRIWGAEQFAEVIDTIPSSFKIVLSGAGNGDDERASIISKKVKNSQRIINMVNKTSVKDLVSWIANATFVVGNDSAAVHIAAATRVPSVCILPGAHFMRFVPYPQGTLINDNYLPHPVYSPMSCFGCGYHCIHPIQGRYECLRRISAEDVNKRVRNLLDPSPNN